MKLLDKIINEVLLEDMFSGFKYKIPSDPEILLYDFYFLSMFLKKPNTRDETFNYVIHDTAIDVIDYVHKHMTEVFKWALVYEYLFYLDVSYSRLSDLSGKSEKFMTLMRNLKKNDNTELAKDYLEKNLPGEIKNQSNMISGFGDFLAAMEKMNISDSEFAIIMKDVHHAGWEGTDEVDANWEKIANCFYHLTIAKSSGDKLVWIDTAYNLQHTNGSIFEKLASYSKDVPKGTKGGFGLHEYLWVERALTWKMEVQDIRAYYNKVSYSLKPMVLFASKNIYDKAMDSYMPFPKNFLGVKESEFLNTSATQFRFDLTIKSLEALYHIRDNFKKINPEYSRHAAEVLDDIVDFDEFPRIFEISKEDFVKKSPRYFLTFPTLETLKALHYIADNYKDEKEVYNKAIAAIGEIF